MLQFIDVQSIAESSENILQNINFSNGVAMHESFQKINDVNLLEISSANSAIKFEKTEKYVCKKDIYVCTFCQVFSPYWNTVAEHISAIHSKALPAGTIPENFISKLQSLEGNPEKKRCRVGRPKKDKEVKRSVVQTEIKQPVQDPVPDANGIFWCKKCLRNFRKPRQLVQHVCFDDELSSDESCLDFDGDTEFKTHMDANPIPWERKRRKQRPKENKADDSAKSGDKITESSASDINNKAVNNKVASNWRKDPSYVPLFDNEGDKLAFERHLRTIDCSCVDDFFLVEEKRCRNKSQNPCSNVQSILYTCKYCKKSMSSLSLIRLHCLIHSDFRPFTCPKCPYRSNSKGSLYMHMRKHTGNVFSCSMCDFKCSKRSHLFDHEATHSSVSQICKLCKNSYKTLRSLIAHIRKYHNYEGGRKYMRSLTAKQSKQFKCDKCNKKFKSSLILENHHHACHENETVPQLHCEVESQLDQCSRNLMIVIERMQVDNPSDIEHSPQSINHNNSQVNKDPLAEIVLNNFLQQEQSQALDYDNAFSDPGSGILSQTNNPLLESFSSKSVTSDETSLLEECQETLILKRCLQDSNFRKEYQSFSLLPSMSVECSLEQNNHHEADSASASHLSVDKNEEPKSAEIKLFEKCQRAPAYVCCVCSAIYICPSTLKAHLREHVNNTSNSLMDPAEEQFEQPTKMSEATNELDVILQDSNECCSFDKELEKLYTSSLDMMYYLPEVSVVLENDPALFDSVLDDISNFTMSVKAEYEDEDESILKCFDEL